MKRKCGVEKPASITLTIPAHFHDAVMRLSPEQRCDRMRVNEVVRLATRTCIADLYATGS